MSERDFEAGGRKFKLNKIDAFKQFHIVRRISPLLAKLVPVMSSITKAKVGDLSEEQKLDEFGKLAVPIMMGLSELSDADADYVLFRLLGSVEVQQEFSGSTVWAKVATDSAIMMQDIELPILLQVAGKALMYNLSGFFGSLPRK